MDENTIDLRELLDIILNNIRKIAKITLACIAIAVLYLLIASPVYESQSLLRIKQQQGLGDSLLAVVRHINLGSIRHFKLVENNIKQFTQHINLCFFCALF